MNVKFWQGFIAKSLLPIRSLSFYILGLCVCVFVYLYSPLFDTTVGTRPNLARILYMPVDLGMART